MKPLIPVLESYFGRELPKLKTTYQWKIPQIDGFNKCGERGYSANIELKKYFHEKWGSANAEEKLVLAKQVVSDWGGVRNNKESTLLDYIKEADKQKPECPIKGIASYSKIFAITDLSRFAIYDARVAVSLNAIQWNAGLKNGIAFNYVPGRNNVTGNVEKKIGFVYQSEFKTGSLVKAGWKQVKRDNTYSSYLELLNSCLASFPNYNLYDLEMVLFANAEIECGKAQRIKSLTRP